MCVLSTFIVLIFKVLQVVTGMYLSYDLLPPGRVVFVLFRSAPFREIGPFFIVLLYTKGTMPKSRKNRVGKEMSQTYIFIG